MIRHIILMKAEPEIEAGISELAKLANGGAAGIVVFDMNMA